MGGARVAAVMIALTTLGGIGCASSPKNISSSEPGSGAFTRSRRTSGGHGARREASPSVAAVSPAPAPDDHAVVRVLGEVERPGVVPFRKGADLAFYLSKAGGPPPDGEIRKVQIIRGRPGRRTASEYSISVADPSKLPPVKDGDIVIFHADKDGAPTQRSFTAAAAATVLGTLALLIIAI